MMRESFHIEIYRTKLKVYCLVNLHAHMKIIFFDVEFTHMYVERDCRVMYVCVMLLLASIYNQHDVVFVVVCVCVCAPCEHMHTIQSRLRLYAYTYAYKYNHLHLHLLLLIHLAPSKPLWQEIRELSTQSKAYKLSNIVFSLSPSRECTLSLFLSILWNIISSSSHTHKHDSIVLFSSSLLFLVVQLTKAYCVFC